MSHVFVLCLCFQGVLGLRLQSSGKKTGWIPPDETVAAGLLFEGPWTKTHHCNELQDPGFEPVKLCKDGWEQQQLLQHPNGEPCVAYDVGVRDVADFALTMIEQYGCTVRAYDPSPTTRLWWEESKNPDGNKRDGKDVGELAQLHQYEKDGKYKISLTAAGGSDGDLKLYAYSWQQVGIWEATDETKDKQQEFIVKSKTLPTMMEENGDKHIDILKVDIEGSEFNFLNAAFDKMGCLPVEHMLFEWHSTNMDKAYGAPPEVKALEERMEKCGYKKYSYYPFFSGNPTGEEEYDIHTTYYGHAAYCKTCIKEEVQEE